MSKTTPKKTSRKVSKHVTALHLGREIEKNIKLKQQVDNLNIAYISVVGQLAIYQVISGALNEAFTRSVFSECEARQYKGANDFFSAVVEATQRRIKELDSVVADAPPTLKPEHSQPETRTEECPTPTDSSDMSSSDAWD